MRRARSRVSPIVVTLVALLCAGSWGIPPAVALPHDRASGPTNDGTDLAGLLVATPASTYPATGVAAQEPHSEPAATPSAASPVSEADAETFAAILSGPRPDLVAGPFHANVKESEGTIALSWADVNLSDFWAHAVAHVPNRPSRTPWDAGFVFRFGPEGTYRVTVNSLAQWSFSVGTDDPAQSGPISNLETTPGAQNELDLLVEDNRAWLGVNGELVGTIALPSGAGAADVGFGAGFYVDEIVGDRVTMFADFTIHALPPGSLGPAETTPDEEAFLTMLGGIADRSPAAGPKSGRLMETIVGPLRLSSSGVSLADFAAEATFVNPDDPDAALWDIGFQFRSTGDERNWIVVDSTATVFTMFAGQDAHYVGRAPSFDATAGGSNTLQLFVKGDRAYLGVNGELVAVITVPAAPGPSDVLAGIGFFSEDFVPGRITDYEDFRVWELT